MVYGMAIVNTIGVISGLVTIFGFGQSQYQNAKADDLVFAFKIGLDGASLNGSAPLQQAGGTLPDIRVYDNQGNYLGKKIGDKEKCDTGEDNCVALVKNVKRQPSYALLTGNTDALCIAMATVTYPSGDRHYSDIDIQVENGTAKLMCAWVDLNGDQPTTGIQIHWPGFKEGFEGNGNDAKYYCQNNPTLMFHTQPDIKTLTSWPAYRATGNQKRHERMIRRDPKARNTITKRTLSETGSLIHSQSPSHSACKLCSSPSSVGPSLVSEFEQAFCHMTEKKVYKFCENVVSGACWDNEARTLSAKGKGALAVRAVLPEVKFDRTIKWGRK